MTYGTEMEEKALKIIKKHFPDYEIVTPALDEHQEGCRYSIDGKYLPGKEIGYFLRLSDETEFGCFLQYYSGEWSAGSATEVNYMLKAGKKIFLINLEDETLKPITKPVKSLTFEETSKRLGEAGIKRLM